MERAEFMQKLVVEFNRLGIAYDNGGYNNLGVLIVSKGEKRTYISFYLRALSVSTNLDGERVSGFDLYYEDIESIFFDDERRRLFVSLGRNYVTVDL